MGQTPSPPPLPLSLTPLQYGCVITVQRTTQGKERERGRGGGAIYVMYYTAWYAELMGVMRPPPSPSHPISFCTSFSLSLSRTTMEKEREGECLLAHTAVLCTGVWERGGGVCSRTRP